MFSLDSVFELGKSLVKFLVIFLIGIYTALSLLPSLMNLPLADPLTLAALLHLQMKTLFGWTVGIFVAIALIDLSYQKYAFAEKMKMSMEDIKREQKNSDGDPKTKAQRQALAREWATGGTCQAAREARVLVVNPTHVAIALGYDEAAMPVPTVTARGEGDVALAMRAAARDVGVPILRNVPLARRLLAETEVGDLVPRELFTIVAQVIMWAESESPRQTSD